MVEASANGVPESSGVGLSQCWGTYQHRTCSIMHTLVQ